MRLASLLVALVLSPLALAAPPTYDLPRLPSVTLDASDADWSTHGLSIPLLAPDDFTAVPDPRDSSASLRLAWDDAGLLLLLRVRDDQPVERPESVHYFSHDSLEIFLSDDSLTRRFQAILSPGRDPRSPEPRQRLVPLSAHGQQPPPPLKLDLARVNHDDGYTLEARLPWSNLAYRPSPGHVVAFQLYVNDLDRDRPLRSLRLYPATGAHENALVMVRLRLLDQPSTPPVLGLSLAAFDPARGLKVDVLADPTVRTVSLRDGARDLASLTLADAPAAAAPRLFSITLPVPPVGKPFAAVTASLDDRSSIPLDLPDANFARMQALADCRLTLEPSCFDAAKFPDPAFANPHLVEQLIGPFTLKTTYYDAHFNPVTAPAAPGRYGAVVTLTPANPALKPFDYYRTLYRAPGSLRGWWFDPPRVEFTYWPEWLGVDPRAAARQSRVAGDLAGWAFNDFVSRESEGAALLAGLHETSPDGPPTAYHDDALAADRQWWVALKRRLAGTDKRFVSPVVAPTKVPGLSAPVVHVGTLAEAGMKPDAVERIDRVLSQWAADTDQAFAVCVARHGVVAFHKAYGTREGKPMTTDTPSIMASSTKTLFGMLWLMALDQGLVDLDAPIENYLPAFAGRGDVKTPVTLRRLFAHTSGIYGFPYDWDNGAEHLPAAAYPFLPTARSYVYQGGYAVASKLLEHVTGEAIPQFYQRHLFAPLQLTNTQARDSAGSGRSVPLDLARIAQVLLNKGAYGDLRFFSEATFNKILPTLNEVSGSHTGLGTTWMDEDVLGPNTFGHGAASSMTFRVVPSKDMVIIMTRNQAGRNFDKYHPLFLRAVADSVASDDPPAPPTPAAATPPGPR